MYKDKPLFVKILLVIWQLPQLLIGLIMLAIFHNKTVYTNSENKVSVWNVNTHHAFGNACFSLGPIIFTCNNKVEEDTIKHETGHSLQSIRLSWLYLIVIPIPSICLFWYRRIMKKDMNFYYGHFPENWAEKLGQTNRYKTKIIMSNKQSN